MAMLEASREETVDVAVVGGGPGGLATAAAVVSAFGDSASVKVFESLKGFKLQGSVIGVAVNAQHALEAINPDLLTKFTSQGLTIDEMSHYDTMGKLTSNHSIARQAMKDFSEKYNKMPFLLGWHECRQLLFDELPPGTVQFDKQMRHYEEGEDGVTLHFDRGQPPVHAKVLVGADGYFSKVRTQCLNDGPPTFNGAVLWRARVGWQEGMPTCNHVIRCREPGVPMYAATSEYSRFALLPMGTLENTKHKGWTWIMAMPLAEVLKAGVDFDPNNRTVKAIQGDAASGSALEDVLQCFSHYPDNFLDIVRNTDPSTVTQHGLYIRELTHDHRNSPVCSQVISSLPQQNGQNATHNGQKSGFDRESPLTERQHEEVGQGSSRHSPQAELAPPTPQQTSSSEALLRGQDQQQANNSTPEASHPLQDRQQASNVTADASLSAPAAQDLDQNSAQAVGKAENSKENVAFASSSGLKQDTASNAPQEAPQGSQEATGQASLQAQSEGDANQGDPAGRCCTCNCPKWAGLLFGNRRCCCAGLAPEKAGLLPTSPPKVWYEEERLPRVKTLHMKGTDGSSPEEKEKYMYKPTFKPLWFKQEENSESICINDFEPYEFE
ncbi:hypothetical protein WJX77_011733 [Trebouxia sp. C0004]